MDALTEARWREAMRILTSEGKSKKTSKGLDTLTMATAVFMKNMDPASDSDYRGSKVSATIKTILRMGLSKWAGDWLLERFRKDTLERLEPKFAQWEKDLERLAESAREQQQPSQQQLSHVSTTEAEVDENAQLEALMGGSTSTKQQQQQQQKDNHRLATLQIIHASITAIHERFWTCRQISIQLDSEIQFLNQDPSLEITKRFQTQFIAELSIRLSETFDGMGDQVIRTVFEDFERLVMSDSMTMGSSEKLLKRAGGPRKGTTTLLTGSVAGKGIEKRGFGLEKRKAMPNRYRMNNFNEGGQDEDDDWEESQQLGFKKRRTMQDGRSVMDMFVDEDNELLAMAHEGSNNNPSLGTKKTGRGTPLSTTTTATRATLIFAETYALAEAEPTINLYLDLCRKLEVMGFTAKLTDIVTKFLYQQIEQKILRTFKGQWSTMGLLEKGIRWLRDTILTFLRLTFIPNLDHESLVAQRRFRMWAGRLEYNFLKTFGELRMIEFFDIILSCPKSEPSIHDLKQCIEWTGQKDQLLNCLSITLEIRLLHPGAETVDIIDFYISAIKYLRVLDPSGVMLDQTARQINSYLRTRDDTMRAIATCIVDDANDLLGYPPLNRHGSITGIEGSTISGGSNGGTTATATTTTTTTTTTMEFEFGSGNNNNKYPQNHQEDDDEDDYWIPEPVHAGPDLSSARRRMVDIISVLANIYDTNDLFIEEFKTLLADRLIQAKDYNVDKEIRQLELMKLRFGEADLHQCGVMLKDLQDSKNVNGLIHQNLAREKKKRLKQKQKLQRLSAASGSGSASVAASGGGGGVIDAVGSVRRRQFQQQQPQQPQLQSQPQQQQQQQSIEKKDTEDDHFLPVQATIASRHYWPAFAGSPTIQTTSSILSTDGSIHSDRILRLPSKLDTMLKNYNQEFEKIKPDQRLEFMPKLGLIEIEVELQDRVLNLTVQPILVAILCLFEEKPKWTLEELGKALDGEQDDQEQDIYGYGGSGGGGQNVLDGLAKRVKYWIHQGVVKEVGRHEYILVESLAEGSTTSGDGTSTSNSSRENSHVFSEEL